MIPPSSRDRVWRPYCQMKIAPSPVRIARTQGSWLMTDDGRRLIDGMASWWSTCHGYNHPAIVDAVRRQAEVMPHVMFGGITHDGAERLAQRLVDALPGDLRHVFFADSGSVAVEVAMKMAMGYWRRHGKPRRTRFVCFSHAYHGDTTGAMSLCDPERSMHASYAGGMLSQVHSPLPTDDATDAHLDRLLDQNREDIAAVIVEPMVQGAGGMRFHDGETLWRIQRACQRHGLLLIFDEIATGFGRTGPMFAMQSSGVTPDIVCLGKALTAGTMTMAVTVAGARVFDAFWSDDVGDALMHGPTFMANPLACAAANASLDVFERQPTAAAVASMERRFTDALEICRDLPGVVDVRCRGAIGVVQTRAMPDVDDLRRRFVDAGVWLRPFGDCIYATPCLNMHDDELATLLEAMVTVIADWTEKHFAGDRRSIEARSGA